MTHKYGTLIFIYLLVPLAQNEQFWNEVGEFYKNPYNNVKTYSLGERQRRMSILKWTPVRDYFGTGQRRFIQSNCTFTNCFVTALNDVQLFEDLTRYDVVLFHGPDLTSESQLPEKRSPMQKYVFISDEPPVYYPLCSRRFNNFFNWTWTYRMDSDINFGYILIKDKNNVVIGPNQVMHWMKLEDMDPVSDEFKEKLKSKTKAAAWFVSNCQDRSGRHILARAIQKELRKFKLDVDIYGLCGTKTCTTMSYCERMLSETYFFYLAFENAFDEDYVTEKLLRALKNNVVPVVYGGANYTKYMPDGIYLNARKMSVELLAKTMYWLMQNRDQYAEFFKWKNHYSFHSRDENPDENVFCQMCAAINDRRLRQTKTTKHNFKEWYMGIRNVGCT